MAIIKAFKKNSDDFVNSIIECTILFSRKNYYFLISFVEPKGVKSNYFEEDLKFYLALSRFL